MAKKKAHKRPGPTPGKPATIRADRLVAARKARGWSAWQLCNEAGLQPSQLTAIENGHRDPQLRAFKPLCQALGVSADHLLGLD